MNLLLKTLRFFFLFILIGSCSGDKPDTKPLKHYDGLISYLALGDSYTIGTAEKPEFRWPYQLADSLRERGLLIDTTAIIATNGWTTGELLSGIKEQSPDSSYDLVSLLIGVNNQYRGYNMDI